MMYDMQAVPHPDDPKLGEGATYMTTNESTPVTGNDSIDLTDEWPPHRDEPDEAVALAVEIDGATGVDPPPEL